jgi:hypothetical protein
MRQEYRPSSDLCTPHLAPASLDLGEKPMTAMIARANFKKLILFSQEYEF